MTSLWPIRNNQATSVIRRRKSRISPVMCSRYTSTSSVATSGGSIQNYSAKTRSLSLPGWQSANWHQNSYSCDSVESCSATSADFRLTVVGFNGIATHFPCEESWMTSARKCVISRKLTVASRFTAPRSMSRMCQVFFTRWLSFTDSVHALAACWVESEPD